MTRRVVVAHLADPHLDGTPAVQERFDRVVRHLHERRAHLDLVVVTGDVVQVRDARDPLALLTDAWARLRAIAPTLLCPGNSDDPAHVAQVTGSTRSLHAGHVRVIGLDSTVPGEFRGAVRTTEVERARDELDTLAPDDVALLALHHPPAPLGHPVVDTLRAFGDVDGLAALAAQPRVVATLAGHTHAATTTTFAGAPLLVAPGIHSGGRHAADAAIGDPTLVDTRTQPAYLLHTVTDATLTSQVVPVPA